MSLVVRRDRAALVKIAVFSALAILAGFALLAILPIAIIPRTSVLLRYFDYAWIGLWSLGILALPLRWREDPVRLVVDERGLDIRDLGKGPIPWSAITGAFVKPAGNSESVCLTVRDADRFLDGVSGPKRKLMEINRAKGFGDLSFLVSSAHTGASAADILREIQRHRGTR